MHTVRRILVLIALAGLVPAVDATPFASSAGHDRHLVWEGLGAIEYNETYRNQTFSYGCKANIILDGRGDGWYDLMFTSYDTAPSDYSEAWACSPIIRGISFDGQGQDPFEGFNVTWSRQVSGTDEYGIQETCMRTYHMRSSPLRGETVFRYETRDVCAWGIRGFSSLTFNASAVLFVRTP